MTPSQAKSPSAPEAIEDQLQSVGPYGTLSLVGGITHEVSERERWMDEHPKAPAQLNGLETKLREAEREKDHERWTVEGELNPRPAPAPAIEHARSRDDSHGIDHDRDYGFGM